MCFETQTSSSCLLSRGATDSLFAVDGPGVGWARLQLFRDKALEWVREEVTNATIDEMENGGRKREKGQRSSKAGPVMKEEVF